MGSDVNQASFFKLKMVTIMKISKTFLILFSVLGIISTSVNAGEPHWDRPSCYIHVHDGCFNNQDQPCTDEEYDEFLDGCDQTYPSSAGIRPKTNKLVANLPKKPLKKTRN